MIVVRVELHSAVTHKITELARMHICNTGEEVLKRRNYRGISFIGRCKEALDKQMKAHDGIVTDWPSEDLHVWNLVHAMLTAMGYVKGPRAASILEMIGVRRK